MSKRKQLFLLKSNTDAGSSSSSSSSNKKIKRETARETIVYLPYLNDYYNKLKKLQKIGYRLQQYIIKLDNTITIDRNECYFTNCKHVQPKKMLCHQINSFVTTSYALMNKGEKGFKCDGFHLLNDDDATTVIDMYSSFNIENMLYDLNDEYYTPMLCAEVYLSPKQKCSRVKYQCVINNKCYLLCYYYTSIMFRAALVNILTNLLAMINQQMLKCVHISDTQFEIYLAFNSAYKLFSKPLQPIGSAPSQQLDFNKIFTKFSLPAYTDNVIQNNVMIDCVNDKIYELIQYFNHESIPSFIMGYNFNSIILNNKFYCKIFYNDGKVNFYVSYKYLKKILNNFEFVHIERCNVTSFVNTLCVFSCGSHINIHVIYDYDCYDFDNLVILSLYLYFEYDCKFQALSVDNKLYNLDFNNLSGDVHDGMYMLNNHQQQQFTVPKLFTLCYHNIIKTKLKNKYCSIDNDDI
ncbi:Hypothetical protein Trvi_ORF5 [Trabala vishnou gigantina nucleopolyhedrovirus]|uniref:Hypothetical protein n=1 Tax=Trabala vishnou gigantina nucleopolyhedrovirus TaxID=2863583 RepID=UPI002481D953|nr:Hypothetical protein QKU87_gp005 [Trabala vishnou gigantina nucleopolyhedrovirus]QYC92673.1 Hypothetical protein Trvi_ORF5 [Trabala vishnou gigantina nucleopolyhedrovirus]